MKKPLSKSRVEDFREKIYAYYAQHKRPFPWRETAEPYKILVSEVMLQQTQTDRVVEKYLEFLEKFPTVQALAKAQLGEVLVAWQGLGYNRRAKYLQLCAQKVVKDFKGKFPDTPEELISLPGIGPYCAASITAFAFNKPSIVIDTNIRSVFIHEFFKWKEEVTDKQLIPLIEQTLDRENPCEWYNALFDYGVKLKKEHPNPTRRSAQYQKQSRFEGSDRQIRGRILKLLIKEKKKSREGIIKSMGDDPQRVIYILKGLAKEGLIKEKGAFCLLA